ncbi:MAG: 5-formyltetrahydrofolate cyclo-ligase [Patescibacteria group bacterium]
MFGGRLDCKMIVAEKSRLRAELLEKLRAFSGEERSRQNAILADKFFALPEFVAAQTIGFFASEPFEVATDFLIERSLQLGKKVGLPRVETPPAPLVRGEQRNLIFHEIKNLADCTPGCFGINCPVATAPKIPLAEIDLLVVPALAFDASGNRLGRGGGFFDRVLEKFRGASVGLAFDFQILEKIPVEKFDKKVSQILIGK